MQYVDAHLHVWRAAEGTTSVDTIVPPQADIPIELAGELMVEHGVDRAVLVQPVFRGEDNRYLIDCVRAQPHRFAAVCVVDPRIAGAERQLEDWVKQGCRGLRLRPRIAEEREVFGDPTTFPLWEAAQRLGVVISLLASPEHAATIDRLCERFAGVPIVIDHMGHPTPSNAAGDFGPLLALAGHSQVYLKLSGFHHISRQRFPFADCWPLVRAAYEHFGPERLIWGSDFPHVLLTTGYAQFARARTSAGRMERLAAWGGDGGQRAATLLAPNVTGGRIANPWGAI